MWKREGILKLRPYLDHRSQADVEAFERAQERGRRRMRDFAEERAARQQGISNRNAGGPAESQDCGDEPGDVAACA